MFQPGVHVPLRGIGAEVGHQAYPQGVRAVPTLYDAQVSGRLCQALPETKAAVILGKSVSLEVTCQQENRWVNNTVIKSMVCRYTVTNQNLLTFST